MNDKDNWIPTASVEELKKELEEFNKMREKASAEMLDGFVFDEDLNQTWQLGSQVEENSLTQSKDNPLGSGKYIKLNYTKPISISTHRVKKIIKSNTVATTTYGSMILAHIAQEIAEQEKLWDNVAPPSNDGKKKKKKVNKRKSGKW